MAYSKIKTESYQLLGGMNDKASPYNNTPNEFRELTNYQFSEPGALDKRYGSTLYAQGSSTKILGLYEFNRLNGASYLLFNDSSGLYKTSLTGTTLIGGYTVLPVLSNYFLSNTIGVTTAGNVGGKMDALSFVDWAFLSFNSETDTNLNNTFNLRKTDGVTLFHFGLPRPPFAVINQSGSTFAAPSSAFVINGGTMAGGSLTTGLYKAGYAYINNRGYIGPLNLNNFALSDPTILTGKYVDNYIDNTANARSLMLGGIAKLPEYPAGMSSIYFTPSPVELSSWDRYGISAIAVFCSLPNQSTPFYLTTIPVSTATFIINNLDNLSAIPANDYGQVLVTVNSDRVAYVDFNLVYSPKILELYQNRLFIGNLVSNNNKFTPKFIGTNNTVDASASIKTFTAEGAKSTIIYSEQAEPEAIDIANNIEVRTNDGDEITGLKSYSNALVITKNRSIHQLNGQDPDNFVLSQVSDIYGCVNNRAMVIFNDILWMLDRKGIIQYNGANVNIVSIKMDSVFNRMNYKFAQKEACAIYHKELNQVWFCFPVDNSEKNNMIVVYDFIANAWTKFEGLEPSVIAIAQGSLAKPQAFFGGYSGGINYFGESFMNDYGKNGITCLFQTPYYSPTGHSTERQFRRYFLDVDPVAGSSTPIQMAFLPNYSTTVGFTVSIYQQQFQTNVNFGIPAKSLSARGLHFSATLPIKVNGYTFESRYQRSE
jgi:hypothetical protein